MLNIDDENGNVVGGRGSSVEFDSYAAETLERQQQQQRTSTPEETGIRKWVANLFMHRVRAGERLLEDGQLATAAAVFADATLLTEQAEAFASAVQRVYPPYFCHLYEQRMLAMGYGHVFFPSVDRETVLRRPSSLDRCNIVHPDDGQPSPVSSHQYAD